MKRHKINGFHVKDCLWRKCDPELRISRCALARRGQLLPVLLLLQIVVVRRASCILLQCIICAQGHLASQQQETGCNICIHASRSIIEQRRDFSHSVYTWS
jgi:hypothetical protein